MASGAGGAVLVTGATGNVGGAVVRHLLQHDQTVVSAVRDAGDPAIVPGSEGRAFDFDDSAGWPSVLQGVDRLFLLRPPAIADVQQKLFPLIDTALSLGVQHIVFLSLQGVQFNRATPHHLVEAHLRSVGAPYTFLRPNFFMQNLSTTYRDDIRDRGQISVPASWARTAFVDTDNVGRVAARVLTESGHAGRAYTLSGEQSLNYDAVARILSDELGYAVRYTRPTAEEYVERLRAQGAASDYVDVQSMIYRVVRTNVSAFPNRTIRRLTGSPATTFAEFVHREREVWARPAPGSEGTAAAPRLTGLE